MLPQGYGFELKEASGDENCALFSVERPPLSLPAPLPPEEKLLNGALILFQPGGKTKGRQIWDEVQLAQGVEEVVEAVDKLEIIKAAMDREEEFLYI